MVAAQSQADEPPAKRARTDAEVDADIPVDAAPAASAPAEPTAAVESAEWMCTRCTLINLAELWECSTCLTPRPSQQVEALDSRMAVFNDVLAELSTALSDSQMVDAASSSSSQCLAQLRN